MQASMPYSKAFKHVFMVTFLQLLFMHTSP